MAPRGEQPAIADAIGTALAPHGLVVRGGFNFGSEDEAPPAASKRPAKSVLLIGNAGGHFWPGFRRWQAGQRDMAHPLDSWCRQLLEQLAGSFQARAISPSDRPFQPFQQWAMRAEKLRPSPLGILMHPDYGLWHAYRGALLFDVEISIQPPATVNHLCDLCAGKPCLKSCPVDAHSVEGFAYQRCLDHVRSPAGRACREQGCFDRNDCPYGVDYRYPTEMQVFIMDVFAG